MSRITWAKAAKADLVALQRTTGIPAIWAAAQMCHEAFNADGSMSGLAANENNFGGLKWAAWQAQYGCRPVTYPTWEWIDGREQRVQADFCSAPDFPTWLRVYGHLLRLDRYRPALKYAADPFLYGAAVWAAGYATDPGYLVGRSDDGTPTGVFRWLAFLWDEYAGTLPGQQPLATPLQIALPDGTTLAGEMRADGTWAPVRRAVESVGGIVQWNGLATGGPAVELKKGSGCRCCS